MVDVLKSVSTRGTPQSQPAGGAQTKNAAGGHVFAIDEMARLRRFLTLGTTGGTYYTKAPELTRQNAEVVISLAKTNPVALVDTLTEISVAGRAPRQNPAIFALAIAASEADEAGRGYALSKVREVVRTGTHMYLFAGYVEQFRGWGPALKRAVAGWYNDRSVEKLTYQILKYRQREGWRHADLLALSHPKPNDPLRDHLFRWIVDTQGGTRDASKIEFITGKHRAAYQSWDEWDTRYGRDAMPELVDDFIEAQAASAKQTWINLIERGHGLSWEMLPDEALTEPLVWEALIEHGLPQTALMKQLPRLTRLGLTTSKFGRRIAEQLQDTEKLKQGRVHPINVLVAARTYTSGHGARGETTWEPTPKISEALDAAFYHAYGAVEPCGKRILLACDVSGSMGSAVSGLPLTCREAVAALALVTLNVEKDCEVIGFSDGRSHGGGFRGFSSWGNTNAAASRLDISPRRRLDDVCSYMAGLNFGRTDCALPMGWAHKNKINFDAIWTLTDNETWYGQIHPWQALKGYRDIYGPTRYGVVAMTATGASIADPSDPSQLDISGFDTNVPQVISQFSAGLI